MTTVPEHTYTYLIATACGTMYTTMYTTTSAGAWEVWKGAVTLIR